MKIKINGQDWDLATVYHPSSSFGGKLLVGLTPAEIQALESLRAENIRNNLAKAEKARLARGGTRLTQAEVDDYAASYQFEQREPSAWRRSPVDEEVRGLAELRAASQGLDEGSLEWDELVQALCQNPALRSEARERVQAKRALLERQLDELV